MFECLHWDPGVRVGIEEIDLEHQTFVLLINQLDAHREQPEMASRTLQALVKYATFHFQSEENIMFSSAYPALDEHWRLHLSLLEHLNNIMLQFRTGEIDYEQVLNFLKDWYCNHTSREDMKFGEFLKSRPGKSGA